MSERILTTHTGSLPRPPDIMEMMLQAARGEAIDGARLQARIEEATRDVVMRQVREGLDFVSDGEFGKPSYVTYVQHRLTGFNGAPQPMKAERMVSRDEFPDWKPASMVPLPFPTNDGPIEPRNVEAAIRDIRNFRAALEAAKYEKAFMTAVSPGTVSMFMPSTFYPSHERYVRAIGAAMAQEYRTVVEAGFTLQVDCPDLAAGFRDHVDREVAELHVEVLNKALEGLPRKQTRIHLCWGNFAGPHNHDVPLAEVLDVACKAKVGAISFEAANPRHAHEWKVFEALKLPDDMKIIPGVIESCSEYVEHPELVAERLSRFAKLVGPNRVMGGSDCGFGTFVGPRPVASSVVWAKLRSLVEGAAIASSML